MKKAVWYIAVQVLLFACASNGGGGSGAVGAGLSLDEAVAQSAQAMVEKLPLGTRVAIVAFEA